MGADAYSSEMRATESELEFLRGLGTHLPPSQRQDRLRLLRSYLESMDIRANWGHIDHAVIRHAVEMAIEREVKSRPVYVPTNGHGLCGARQYAVPVGQHRMEIRRDDSGEDE